MLAIDGLGLGGAEMVVRDLARFLDRDRFDVCVCCTRGLGGSIGEELLRDGIEVFVLPGQQDGRVDYLTALKFRRAVKDKHVDIVHTHAMAALLDAGPCRLTMPRLKVVHTFHFGNYPYDSWRYHMHGGPLRPCRGQVDRSGLGTTAADTGDLPVAGLADRHDLERSDACLADAGRRFRTQVGTGDRLLIGTIAKLIEQKGLDDLLSVARRCRDAGHRMQFVIVGEGPLRPMLEQRRRELGLEDTVVITGWIPNAAAQALPAFDVFFQPSRWEAMSIAILEAMASGKSIVATRVGDNPHVLEDGVSGLLVDPGDIAGMVDALARVGDRERRLRFGQAARARFEERFTLDQMIRGYENVYRELAGC